MLICSFGKTHLTSWTQIRELSTHSSWWRYFDLNRKNRFGVENSILNRGRTSLVLCPKARIQKLSLHRLAQQPTEALVAAGHTSKLFWKFIKLGSARNSCSKLNRGLEGSKWKKCHYTLPSFKMAQSSKNLGPSQAPISEPSLNFRNRVYWFSSREEKKWQHGWQEQEKEFFHKRGKEIFRSSPKKRKSDDFPAKIDSSSQQL